MTSLPIDPLLPSASPYRASEPSVRDATISFAPTLRQAIGVERPRPAQASEIPRDKDHPENDEAPPPEAHDFNDADARAEEPVAARDAAVPPGNESDEETDDSEPSADAVEISETAAAAADAATPTGASGPILPGLEVIDGKPADDGETQSAAALPIEPADASPPTTETETTANDSPAVESVDSEALKRDKTENAYEQGTTVDVEVRPTKKLDPSTAAATEIASPIDQPNAPKNKSNIDELDAAAPEESSAHGRPGEPIPAGANRKENVGPADFTGVASPQNQGPANPAAESLAVPTLAAGAVELVAGESGVSPPVDAPLRGNSPTGEPASTLGANASRSERSVYSGNDDGASIPIDRARFIHRVEGAMRTAHERDGRVQVRLSPPELGSLRIEMSVQHGVLTARLEAETSGARNALLDSLPALRERLAQQEIRIERFDVDIRRDSGGSAGQGGSPDRSPEHSADGRHGSRSTSTSERRMPQEPLAAAPAAAVTDKGLDVRV